jgi:hypothetical protein
MDFVFANNFEISDCVKKEHAIFLAYYKTYLDAHNSYFFSNVIKNPSKSFDGNLFIKQAHTYDLGADWDLFNSMNAQKKFIIDESFLLLDPHRFSDVDDQLVLFPESVKLFDHALLSKQSKELHEHVQVCFVSKGERSSRSKSILQMLDSSKRNRDSLKKNIVKIIPIQQYNDFFLQSGIEKDHLDVNIHFMHTRNPNFVHSQSVISEYDIMNNHRSKDVILTGSNSMVVYPYRYLAKVLLQGIANEIALFDQSNEFNVLLQKIATIQKDVLSDKKTSGVEINSLIYQYYDQYYGHLRSSKIGITCSNVFGYTARRYFEFMANGCVIVGQLPRNSEALGFKHLHNVFECEVDEINDAVKYLLENDDVRIKIALNARKLLLDRYTVEANEDAFLNDLANIVKMQTT